MQHDVVGFQYGEGLFIYRIARLIKYPGLVSFQLQKKFNKILSNQISGSSQNYDLIIIVCGEGLSRHSKRLLSVNKVPIITWLIDTENRYPRRSEIVPFSTRVLYHDGVDFEKSIHPGKRWQPFGFDDTLISNNNDRKYDIMFIGALRKPLQEKRFLYLDALLKSDIIKNSKVCLAINGPDKVYLNHLKSIKEITVYCGLKLPEYFKMLSSSRIVINVMQSDPGKVINPVFFAAIFSSCLQITDERKYINIFFEENLEYFPTTIKNFISTVKRLLDSDIEISENTIAKATKFSFNSVLQSELEYLNLD